MGDRPPKIWAILIGINQYPSGIRNLEGCVRDVDNVESILQGSINIPLEIIKITTDNLNGGPPTYKNILDKFSYVTSEVRQGDFVYFHYSGHGGRELRSHDALLPPSTRPSGDYFECLVLHGDRHLKDYELGNRFDKLASKGATLFAVLDCCHSGGGDRVSSQGIRQIDNILPAHPQSEGYNEEVGQLEESDDRAGSRRPSHWIRPRDYTVLTACQPHEYARECSDGSGERVGVLTLTLLTSLETLRQNGQPLTYKSLFYDIRARVGLQVVDQHPKLFGIEDREVFSHRSQLSTRQAVVNKIKTNPHRVYIDQGEIHGVRRCETWNIYRRGGLQLGTPIATITIDQVGAIQSSATLLADAAGVECGCPASIISPVYGESLLVLVEDSTLRQLLAEEPPIGVELQEPGHTGAVYAIRPTTTDHHRIEDAFGTPLSRSPVYTPGQTSVSELHAFLKTLAHYRRVLNLRNTSSNLGGDFSFVEANGLTTVPNGGTIALKLINQRPLDATLDRTEEIKKRSLYFTVLNLRVDGTVTLLVPHESEGRESLVVAPGETLLIDSIDMDILPTDGDVPDITDIFKVIVTDQPASFYNLATEHVSRSGSLPFEEFNQCFTRMLVGESRGWRAASRGLGVKWQTAQISVTVTRQ
ncbi:caspase domain-containing protein [Hypoxylon rubiginosum]|uniref:Caspase domain-containing protein n=1 Tax=Hypoxylon rubiginosum TaxID=110542 RepID=A0ACC0CLZ8_9PEZI|nr:caspase domain-containing protein [Hypoxylon rubiginosum]